MCNTGQCSEMNLSRITTVIPASKALLMRETARQGESGETGGNVDLRMEYVYVLQVLNTSETNTIFGIAAIFSRRFQRQAPVCLSFGRYESFAG